MQRPPSRHLQSMRQQRQNHPQILNSPPLTPRQIHNQRLPLQARQTPAQPDIRKPCRTSGPHRLRQSGNFAVNHPPRSLRRHVARPQPCSASRNNQRILLVAKLMQQRGNGVRIVRHQTPPNRLALPLLRQHPRHGRTSQIHLGPGRTSIRNCHYPNSCHPPLPMRNPKPNHPIRAAPQKPFRPRKHQMTIPYQKQSQNPLSSSCARRRNPCAN